MRVIQNLALWQKFALLGLLALALILPLSGRLVAEQWAVMRAATKERQAIPAVGALLKLVRDSQVHRGLTAASKSGDAKATERRPAQAEKVESALHEALAAMQGQLNAQGAARAKALTQQWKQLRADVDSGDIAGAESFRRHNALVYLQLRLLADLADDSGMILDPHPNALHLVILVTDGLPRITELLGQARAQGASAIAKGQVLPAQRVLLEGHVAQLSHLSDASERHFSRALEGGEGTTQALSAMRAAAEQATKQAVAQIRTQVLDAATPEGDSSVFFGDLTRHIDQQFKLSDASFARLDELLAQRVASSKQALAGTVALILLGVLSGTAMAVAVARGANQSVRQAQIALSALARGELNHRVGQTANDEAGRIAQQIGQAMRELSVLVGDIKQAGGMLGAASVQIASGNADLAERTQSSAASLQQAASSLQEINATVHQNAANAREAAALAGQASEVAANGGALIGRLVATMDQISQSSQHISDITGVIDGIAFQTNILALNAAVEAARAGEQGRGFAVVASEVRALAQRSANAAREIKQLIGSSVETVESGAKLVGDSRQTIQGIVDQARKVSTMVDDIGRATGTQADGIAQISLAVGRLESATQENAALVEESSAAAGSLRQQADRMVGMVERFRTATT